MTITPELKKYFSDLGKKSANKLTKEQRIERAKKAVKAREERKHKQKITKRIEGLVYFHVHAVALTYGGRSTN